MADVGVPAVAASVSFGAGRLVAEHAAMNGTCWGPGDRAYWRTDNVTAGALHNLSFSCPPHEWRGLEAGVDAPATFFIQLARLSVSLALLALILSLYNSVKVLGRNIFSSATCSFYWALMLAGVSLRAAILLVLLPVSSHTNLSVAEKINQGGFIAITVVQSVVLFLLFCALDHEQTYRSADYASVDLPRRCPCASLHLPPSVLCSWRRAVMLPVSLLPLTLLVATEVVFALNNQSAPAGLVWALVVSLWLPRAGLVAMVVWVCRGREEGARPSLAGKLHLAVAALLSLAEEVPSSVFTVAAFCPSATGNPCLIDLTIYDILQLLGIVSLLFYTLFVRSQYLRVEPECKLAMVWDLQRLLQVNGRQDVVTA